MTQTYAISGETRDQLIELLQAIADRDPNGLEEDAEVIAVNVLPHLKSALLVDYEPGFVPGFPYGTEVSFGGNLRGEVVANHAEDGLVRVRWPNGNRASYHPTQLRIER